MAARDGSGSSRDEIYGFQPIPRAKWKSVYEVLFGRPLSRPPIGRHLFLLIGRGLRRAPGEVGEEWRRRRRRGHRKYDGRTRRWDLSGVGTNERRENLSPLFSVLEGGCEAAIPRPSAPTEHPLDANRYYLAARNEAKSRRGMLEQRALSFLFSYIYVSIIRSSQIYQVSSLLSFLNWSNYLVNCNGMSC